MRSYIRAHIHHHIATIKTQAFNKRQSIEPTVSGTHENKPKKAAIGGL
jgi:hypothetical protein